MKQQIVKTCKIGYNWIFITKILKGWKEVKKPKNSSVWSEWKCKHFSEVSRVCFLFKKCWGTLKSRKAAQPFLMKKQDLYSKESSTNNFIHTWQILSNKFKKTNPCS